MTDNKEDRIVSDAQTAGRLDPPAMKLLLRKIDL